MAELGPEQVVDYARRLGFTSELPPFLSVALGAAEATLLETTSAYTAFPNQGVRLQPFQGPGPSRIATATGSKTTGRLHMRRCRPTRRSS